MMVLRSLKRACYDARKMGHFGLAKDFYAHFTSPIRRYPDLLLHRQLADYLDTLGLVEGWMPIFDEDKSKPWEEKLFMRDIEFNGKTLHVVGL